MLRDTRFQRINVFPITGALGADIRGVDLSNAPDTATMAEVRKALDIYHVIAVREQKLTPASYKAVAARFGAFSPNPVHASMPDLEHIIRFEREPDDTGKVIGEDWHMDLAWLPRPPGITMLYGEIVPAVGGDTCFSSLAMAYRALSPRLRALLHGQTAILRALTQHALLTPNNATLREEQLHKLPTLRLECTKIWQQLSGDEQDTLMLVAHNRPVDGRLAQALSLKGLLQTLGGGASSVFSPLFATFLQTISTFPAGVRAPIQIDPTRRTVLYYGRDISSEITSLEYKLLLYLWQHLNEVCPVAEVAAAVYPDEQHVYDNDISEYERLRTLARRLRQRLERLEPEQPTLFFIFRKRGYRLGVPPIAA